MNYKTQIHIGHEIESRINELRISKTEFARRVGTSKQNINRILEKESIDTALLIKYSEILDYNFFNLYADGSNQITVQATNHSAASGSGDIFNSVISEAVLEEKINFLEALLTEKDERIADLKERIEDLKTRANSL